MSSSAKTTKSSSDKSTDNLTPFVPGFIDDYPFNPEEFRILMRVARRTVGGGECYESIPSLAKSLQIAEKLVRRAVKVLEACRAIKRKTRAGQTDLYEFNPCEKWLPKEKVSEIRKRLTPVRCATSKIKATPVTSATTPLADVQPPPLAHVQGKGISKEGNPIKENTTDADASLSATFSTDEIVIVRDSKSQASATEPSATNDQNLNAPPEAKATSAPKNPTPPETKDEVRADQTYWDVWVRIEKSHGVLEQTARARLGKLIKEFGADLVSSAINENLALKADAFAYLKGTLTKLRDKKATDDLIAEQWLGEQKYIKDDFTRQLVPNPYHGDPRFLPNFSVPNLIPEWYRATAARLQSRRGGAHAA